MYNTCWCKPSLYFYTCYYGLHQVMGWYQYFNKVPIPKMSTALNSQYQYKSRYCRKCMIPQIFNTDYCSHNDGTIPKFWLSAITEYHLIFPLTIRVPILLRSSNPTNTRYRVATHPITSFIIYIIVHSKIYFFEETWLEILDYS